MPTLVYLEGFEHKTFSVLQFGGSGTGIFDGSIANGAGITADTSVFRSGAVSARIATGGVATNFQRTIAGAPSILVISVAIRLDSLPAADSEVFGVLTLGGINPLRLRFRQSDSKWIGRLEDVDIVGPTAVAGTWHQFDFSMVTTITPWVLGMQVDGTDFGTTTRATAGSTVTNIRFGTATTHTFTANYDDCVASTTLLDFPLGDLAVLSVVPTSDGTHNGGTNTIEDNAGTDIVTPGYTTAYQLVDEWPANSTDYVQQAIVGAGTEYAEVNFADTTETTIHDVRALAALRAATTSTNDGETRIIDNSGTSTVVYNGDMSETAIHYKSVIVTRPGGGWTTTEFNALKARVGFSGDATPDPWWTALMLQYAVPYVPPPVGDTAIKDVIQSGGIIAFRR